MRALQSPTGLRSRRVAQEAEGWDCQNALAAGLWMRSLPCSLEKKKKEKGGCKNEQLKRKKINKLQKYVR